VKWGFFTNHLRRLGHYPLAPSRVEQFEPVDLSKDISVWLKAKPTIEWQDVIVSNEHDPPNGQCGEQVIHNPRTDALSLIVDAPPHRISWRDTQSR
jgi:hypothetical protein